MALESYYLCVCLAVAYISVGSLPTSTADSVQTSKNVGGVRMEDVSEYSSNFLSDTNEMPTFIMGDKSYHFELEEPSADDEVMNAARERIGETPEVMEKAKQELINLLENDSELNVPLENDAWLTRFLRLKNYNARKAYEHIKAYYRFRSKNKFLYDNMVPSELTEVAEAKILKTLQGRDQLGRRVIVVRMANWKPAEHPLLDIWRLSAVLGDIGAYEPATQIAGSQVIYDMNGLNWQHIRQFSPTVAARMISWLMTLPTKVAAMHIVNQPPIFSALFKIFRPFLTKEIKGKLFFHGNNMKSLHQHISPSSLPKTYGGTYNVPDLSANQWEAFLKAIEKEIASIDSYGIKSKN